MLNFSACSPGNAKDDSKTEEATTQKMVDKSLLTVDVTIPASFFSEENPASEELSDEQKEEGFKSAKINADGSLTYAIKKSSWKKLLEEFKADVEKTLNELSTSGEYAAIKKVTYNDDFSKIILDVNREEFENGTGSFAALSAYFSIAYYQLFNKQEPHCSIAYRDVNTNETFNVVNYPIDSNE